MGIDLDNPDEISGIKGAFLEKTPSRFFNLTKSTIKVYFDARMIQLRKILYAFAMCIGLPFFISCSTEAGESTEICFVGDSITDLWDVEYHFQGRYIHKLAVGGSKVEDLLRWNLRSCNDIPTVLLIGTNNIPYLKKGNEFVPTFNNENFYADYAKLVKKINPSRLYAISILPREILFIEDPRVNGFISEVNDSLLHVLKKMDIEYEFVNAYPEFLDRNGNLIDEYFVDGLHLSAEGYEILSAGLRKRI